MNRSRRTFLAGAGAAVSGGLLAPAGTMAAAEPLSPSTHDVPRGLTFATIRRGGEMSLAIKTERGLLDVRAAESAFHQKAPTTVDDVIRHGGGTALQALLAKAVASARKDLFLDEGKADFGPCVTSPEKIVCVGVNYRKHAAETGSAVPTQPILFNKYNTALNCCGGEIAVSKEKAAKFDYEAELVIVLGRTARNVAEADALGYIFGYCTGNDFTARDLQSVSSQWMLGKSLDGSGPIGPWLVTADQVDGDNLNIECRVNGEVRQSSNTSDMVFNCRQLVSYASRYFTLKPGDIIFTGTPEGVISGYPKDKQVWLKAGDTLVTSIEKLGDLEFKLT